MKAIPNDENDYKVKTWEMAGLHEDTALMVGRFAKALASKLELAQRKYGYTDGWRTEDWEDECRRQLMIHIKKGDPLDVAAYCMFMYARRWSTNSQSHAKAAS